MNKFFALSFLLVQLFIFNPSYACRCVETTGEELLDNADHVFVAYITSSVVNKEESRIDFKFDVTDTLKGDPSKVSELTTGFHSCKLTLRTDSKYLVLIRGDNNHVDRCSGTHGISYLHTKKEQQEYISILKGYIDERKPITRQNVSNIIKQDNIEKCEENTHPLAIEITEDFYEHVER